MPCIARVLLQQSDQNQGPSFSKINLTSKTYNGEWALVGEFVKQLSRFALGEFWHPALANTSFLAEAAPATRMTWKKPLPVALLQNNPCQQPTTFGAVRTVPAQAARLQEATRR